MTSQRAWPQGRAKYAVVRERLAGVIASSSPGDRLPSESELCQQHQVSRITIRRAVDDLIAAGLLVRQQGRGTFVAAPAPAEGFHESFADRVRGFYRQQTEAGRDVATRVLRLTVAQDAEAAARLGLPPDTDLVVLGRVRLVDGVVRQVSTTWLEAAAYPRALAHDFAHGSLYEFLERAYGVFLARNELVVTVARLSAELADALECAEDEPVLAMTSLVSTAEPRPVAFGVTHFTPRSSEIVIHLSDQGAGPARAELETSPRAGDA